jgi:hypothetical protein
MVFKEESVVLPGKFTITLCPFLSLINNLPPGVNLDVLKQEIPPSGSGIKHMVPQNGEKVPLVRATPRN